ncbi:MAG: tripartite tricarboxylate transporter TctB family protein [Burkholderiaceae bacterium]
MAINNATPTLDQSDGNAGKDEEAGHPVEDLISAAIFIILGVGAFIMALDYRTGTLYRMGPGIFPLIVSGLMAILGVALAVQAVVAWRLRRVSGVQSGLLPDFAAMRALIITMVSLLAFALLIRTAGMMIAITAMVFIATRAQPGRPILSSLVLSISLAVICAAIFVYGIGIPISLWP